MDQDLESKIKRTKGDVSKSVFYVLPSKSNTSPIKSNKKANNQKIPFYKQAKDFFAYDIPEFIMYKLVTKKHAVSAGSQLLVEIPLNMYFENCPEEKWFFGKELISISPQDSLTTRATGAAFVLGGVGYAVAKIRSFVHKKVGITDSSPLAKRIGFDVALFSPLFGIASMGLYSLTSDMNVADAFMYGCSTGAIFGGLAGVAMDLNGEMMDTQKSTIFPNLDRLSKPVKRSIAATTLITSLALSIGIYSYGKKNYEENSLSSTEQKKELIYESPVLNPRTEKTTAEIMPTTIHKNLQEITYCTAQRSNKKMNNEKISCEKNPSSPPPSSLPSYVFTSYAPSASNTNPLQ